MKSHQHYSSQQCPVCGSTAVDTDEVQSTGILLLAECLRCEFRWTHALGAASLQARQRASSPQARGAWSMDGEVASAA